MPFEITLSVIILMAMVLTALKPHIEITKYPSNMLMYVIIRTVVWVLGCAVWLIGLLATYWFFMAMIAVLKFISIPQVF